MPSHLRRVLQWRARARSARNFVGLRALLGRGRADPFEMNLSIVSVPIGLMGLAIGPEVSRAFTVVFHTEMVIYLWGSVLLLGGLHVSYGVIRRIPSTERAGQYVLAAAWAFYGTSVIIGLRAGGLVAGPLALAMAVSCLQRAAFIMTTARVLAHATKRTGAPEL